MKKEIWKDIPEYEGLYQVSNLGRIKSLPKQWSCGQNTIRKHNGKILKTGTAGANGNEYLMINLCKNKKRKTVKIHQIVAVAFLNHKINGHKLVVDHINDNRFDNRVENLQIVTQRFNALKTQGIYSSKYKGVNWHKKSNKWRAKIYINKKHIHLGLYENEYDAHLSYQNALKNI
jgi:hypothetical protein